MNHTSLRGTSNLLSVEHLQRATKHEGIAGVESHILISS